MVAMLFSLETKSRRNTFWGLCKHCMFPTFNSVMVRACTFNCLQFDEYRPASSKISKGKIGSINRPMISFMRSVGLTSRSWVLIEKPLVAQLLQNFSTFYGTQRFITMFTRVRHRNLSWARWIQSISPSHLSKIHFNIILQSMSRSS
jgi:hypothetical protein